VAFSEQDFAALYRAYAPGVYRRALRLTGSPSDADDVVAEIFTSLLERPQQYAGRSALSTFLYGVTTHACLVRLRNQRRRSRLLAERHEAASPYSRCLGPEGTAELRALLRRLPDPLAEVAVYYHLDELTHQEMADVLGCSRRTVGNLLKRLETALGELEQIL